jgi:cell division protein FtsW
MAPEPVKTRPAYPASWLSRRLSDLPTPPEVVAARELRERASKQALAIEYHLLMLLTLGLVAFGLVMVYSSSSGVAVVAGGNSSAALIRQGIYAVLGLGAMAVAARVPYQRWRPLIPLVMLVSMLLLIAVLIPGIGVRVGSSARWIDIGPLTIQPSEFAKLAVALFACQILAARRRPPTTIRQLLNPVGVVALVACTLVLAEPDLGTTISIAIMVGGVLVIAGTPFRLLLATVTVMSAGAAVGISQNAYMKERLLTFLDPWHVAGTAGYQNVQALIALGSGGVWGKGLGQGTQKIFYLPEANSDMIAAVIGEELGLIGILATAIAFAAFAVLGYRIAMRCDEPFGKYLAAGITTMVTGQAIVNLGAVLGFLPLTGVPLPLISSGGSSLVVFMTMAGMLLSIAEGGGARPVRATAADAKPDAKSEPKARKASTPASGRARPDRRRRNRRPRRAGAGGGS